MKLSKFANWFYLEGNKFRDIKDLVIDEDNRHFIIDDKANFGKIFFEARTSRQGKRGYGKISCLTTEGLQELKKLPTENYEEFIEYFSDVISANLCSRLKQVFKKKEKLQKIIDNLRGRYSIKPLYTWAMDELMREPLDYFGRFLSIKTEQGKSKGLTQIEKLLHQIFVLLILIQITYPEEILDEAIKLEQRKKSGIEKLDYMMPISWDEPTIRIKVNGKVYSIWYEFSAPHPLEAKKKLDLVEQRKTFRDKIGVITSDTRKIFDIIVKKGDFESMFLSKPMSRYKEIKDMDEEQFFDLPNHFFKEMKKIDLLIECKEQKFDKWKNDVENQIIPYMETYKPNKMVVISAYPIMDENAISKLKEKGITTIAPFGFENESYDKERELRNAVIDC